MKTKKTMCFKCKKKEAIYLIGTPIGRPFCEDCYIKYSQRKLMRKINQMEKNGN